MTSPSTASLAAVDHFAGSLQISSSAVRTANPCATSLVLRLLAEAAETIDSDRELAHGTLTRALALLVAERSVAARHAGRLAPWQANKATAYIENNLESGASVVALAAVAKLSRSHFSRAFKATFGTSPTQYTLGRRIAQARRLLVETEQPLCEVALTCGFADQAHLSRTFRRFVGQSPNEWRRARRPAPVAPIGHTLQ